MVTDNLEVFIDVGEELNFSVVAQKRYTTQPTISRQIAELEKQWDLILFERSNKGLRLTVEGAIMLSACKKSYQQLTQALEQAREITVGKKDKLQLGFLTDMNAEQLFMPAVHDLAKGYEQLDIALSYHSFRELRAGLKSQHLDIIFTYDFELANIKDDVIAEYVTEVTPCLAISKEHPLYEKENLTVADLSDETFYLPEELDSPGREKDLRYLLRAHKIADSKIRFATNQESVLLQVRLGRGVAVIDSGATQIEKYNLRLVPLGEGKKFSKLGIVAVWKKDNLNPFLTMFMQKVKENLTI
ncbi:MAG: LysR family transcriptional regulator [Eubacterium sp.]|nr:LysR family transcriptional regulator [Eubacterium sp.]